MNESIEVIMPARGPTPWLSCSINSIGDQSLAPTRVTIIDDGVDDATPTASLGRTLFGDRFRLIKNQGRGISAALNTAVQQSSAEWIARMDTDDIAHPQRLEKQIAFLKAQSGGAIGCGTQIRFINRAGAALGCSRLPTAWPDILRQIYRTTTFVHPSLMIRTDALLSTPYRSAMDGGEDVDLILRLVERGKILNLDEALLDYRLDPTQESFRARARHTAIQELAFRLARARQKTGIDPLAVAPHIAESFLRWRLSDPAYVKTRCFLTAARYMATYLRGNDWQGFAKLILTSLRWFPTTPSSIRLSLRVARHAGAALLDQVTPFAELNR